MDQENKIEQYKKSKLARPWRSNWRRGYTVDELNKYTPTEYDRAVVVQAGDIETWVALTDGGRIGPENWPFDLPDWPPAKPEPVETKPEPLPPTAGGGIPVPGEPKWLDRIERKIDALLRHASLDPRAF